MPITTQLRRGEREFALPATLTIEGGEAVHCAEVLRVLPGTRVTMAGRFRGRAVVAKIMAKSASGWRNKQRELAGHQRVKAVGLNTPALLWAGRCAGGDDGYALIFNYVDGAQRIGDVLYETIDPAKTVAPVLAAVAALHRGGCIHTDPHAHNFLVVAGKLYVVDVASVRRRWPRGGRYRPWQRSNLARFLTMFAPPQRNILLDLLKTEYPEAAGDAKLTVAVARAERHNKNRNLKKCMRECTEFCARFSWRQAAVWKRTYHSEAMMDLLQNPDDWMARAGVQQTGDTTATARIRLGETPALIKRYSVNHADEVGDMREGRADEGVSGGVKMLLRSIRNRLVATPARIAWCTAHRNRMNGMAVSEPIAFMEKRCGPLCGDSHYICADAVAKVEVV